MNEKKKITSNDVLEALSIRTNQILRTEKDSKDQKNSLNFWIFKFIYLAIYIFILSVLFDSIRDGGVEALYFFGKSLRSVLSSIWAGTLDFTKDLIVLFLIFDHLKIFTESKYYKMLYSHDEKMKKNKETFFKVITVFLKVFAVCLMVIVGVLGALSMFMFIYFIVMLINGTYVISPMIIFGSIFAICLLLSKHIQYKFFEGKFIVFKNYYLVAGFVFVLGVCLFAYELSSYEYNNSLPVEFNMNSKETVFDISEYKDVNIKSKTRLNNIELLIDDNLINDVRVELDYYKTADIRYIYKYNDDNSLILEFESDFEPDDEVVPDLFKLIMATFNNQTVYNYNLFKYPNIKVYVSSNNYSKVTVSHY